MILAARERDDVKEARHIGKRNWYNQNGDRKARSGSAKTSVSLSITREKFGLAGRLDKMK